MFDHLDDPDGYRPSPTTLVAVQREGRRRRRRTHLARTGVASVAAVGLGVGAVALRLDRQLDSVDRVEVAGLTDADPDPAQPYTILFTGIDATEPVDPTGARIAPNTDTIALIRVLPAEERVLYLSLPRDLWVDIADHGPGRINSALALGEGGPGLLVKTIEESFGIEVNHYVQLDFAGARALGDAVGGLRFGFDHPTRDRMTGLEVTEAGCQALDGMQLLALARARHLEVEVAPGMWVSDRTSDFGRMARQHQVALAGLAAFGRLDPADPVGIDRFVDALVDNAVVDPNITGEGMIDLFRDLAGSRLEPVWLPVEEWTAPGGAQVLIPADDGSFQAVVDRFRSGGMPPAGGEPGPPRELIEAIVPSPC